MSRSRNLLPILLIAAVHLALTPYALLASLYLTFPGEPGFDPGAPARAVLFGRAIEVLGFPVLPILLRVPAITACRRPSWLVLARSQ